MEQIINCPCGHTYPEKILMLGSQKIVAKCPVCDDDPNGVTSGRRRANEAMQRAESIVTNTRLSRIPPRFADETLETYDPRVSPMAEKAFFCANQYASAIDECIRRATSLIFVGTYGTGKTHLAVALMKKALEAGHTALFVSARNIPLKIKDTFHKTKSELEAIAEFSKPKILIIDEVRESDLIASNESTWARDKFFAVIDDRYLEKKPTIITSNLTKTKLIQLMTMEAVSRICQGKMEESMPIFDWDSYRK